MIEPYPFGVGTPGQRMAARGSVACRPGHPGYVDEELRALCAVLTRSPGVRVLLGSGDLAVAVGVDRTARTLSLVVSAV